MIMITQPHLQHISSRQGGSALIVSLLILLVLTVIGVTSMSTTSLQSKMATNTREYNIGFQAAESALRDGEAEVRDLSPVGFDAACTNGLCLAASDGTPVWSSTKPYWAKARAYGSQTGASQLLYLTDPALKPKYLIEKLPLAPAPGDNTSQMGCYNCSLPIQNYRITASGTGANGTASVVLQSVYRPN